MFQLIGPEKTPISFLGPGAEAGPLPAFLYFALSAEESLELHPYNQPALHVASEQIRVFSFTIPGHEPGQNKHHAMQYWADQMLEGDYILKNFFNKIKLSIDWLIDNEWILPEKIASGGLSRGGFIATHVAAIEPRIRSLLAFAPLTELMLLKEFAEHPDLQRRVEELDLLHLVDSLTHVRNVRLFIGNRDTRVGTDACYRFMRRLVEKGYEKSARHQKIELLISQSIGHNGHGTSPEIFEKGSLWIKKILSGD